MNWWHDFVDWLIVDVLQAALEWLLDHLGPKR